MSLWPNVETGSLEAPDGCADSTVAIRAHEFV